MLTISLLLLDNQTSFKSYIFLWFAAICLLFAANLYL